MLAGPRLPRKVGDVQRGCAESGVVTTTLLLLSAANAMDGVAYLLSLSPTLSSVYPFPLFFASPPPFFLLLLLLSRVHAHWPLFALPVSPFMPSFALISAPFCALVRPRHIAVLCTVGLFCGCVFFGLTFERLTSILHQ
jgi:hypothetical protein